MASGSSLWTEMQPPVNGKNSVHNATDLITFTDLYLKVFPTSRSVSICMDSYIALKEYYLNTYIVSAEVFSFATIGVNYTDTLSISGSMFDKEFSQYPPYCPKVQPRIGIAHGSSSTQTQQDTITSTTVTAFFDSNNGVANSRLVTHVYIQNGQDQGHNLFPWSLIIYQASWNGNAWVYSYSQRTVNEGGSLLRVFSNYAIAVSIQISSMTNKMNICALKAFGYPYCQILTMALTLGGSPVTVVTLNAGQTKTITITLTYKIDDAATIINNPFCAAGTSFIIERNGTAINMSGILIDPATMTATYTLPLNTQPNIARTDTFQFKARDPRQASSTNISQSITVNYAACEHQTLSQAFNQIVFQNGTAFQPTTYYQGTGEQSFKFSYNSPQCYGFQPTLTKVRVFVNIQNLQPTATIIADYIACQTTNQPICHFWPVTTVLSDYIACQAASEQICFYWDKITNQVQYYSKLPSLFFNSFSYSITVEAQFFALDATSFQITNQISSTLQLTQKSCADTKFVLSLLKNYETWSKNQTSLLDMRTSMNQFVFTTFQVNDTISSLLSPSDQMTWCGNRTFQLYPNVTDPNYNLAQQLMSPTCTSCITLNIDPNNYKANITAKINDAIFAGKNYSFILNVGLSTYLQSLDYPQENFTFTLSVEKIVVQKSLITTVSIFPQFAQQLRKQYSMSCGQSLQFPSILDANDPNPRIIYNFNTASRFIDSNGTTISLKSVCVAGFYPISIRLIDINNATSIYQTIIVIAQSEGLPTIISPEIQSKLSMLFNSSLPNITYNQSKNQSYFPAAIESISQQGLVTIAFKSSILVPNNMISQQDDSKNLKRKLQSLLGSQDLINQFIDKESFYFELVTKNGSKQLEDWACVNMTDKQLKIQINFEDPFAVSSNSKDYIVAKILKPQLFIDKENLSFAFGFNSQLTMGALLPQQAPMSHQQDILNLEQYQWKKQLLKAIIAVIYVILILDKSKSTTQLRIFFLTVQVFVLSVKNSNMILPVSVSPLFISLDDIIFLRIKLQPWTDFSKISGLLGEIGGIQIAFVLVLLLLVGIQFTKWFFERRKMVQKTVDYVYKVIFWGAMIKYFQLTFLNLTYSCMLGLHSTATTSFDLIFTIIVLKLQSMILIYQGVYILFQHNNILERKSTQQKLGAMFDNLDLSTRFRRFYRSYYLFLLSIVSLIIVQQFQPVLQNFLLQYVFVANLVYVFHFTSDENCWISVTEVINAIVLLLMQMYQLLFTAYTTNAEQRYKYGLFFDYFFVYFLYANVTVWLTTQISNYILYRKLQQAKRDYKKNKSLFEKLQADRLLQKIRDEYQRYIDSLVAKDQNQIRQFGMQTRKINMDEVYWSDEDQIDVQQRQLALKKRNSFEINESSGEVKIEEEQFEQHSKKPSLLNTTNIGDADSVQSSIEFVELKPKRSHLAPVYENSIATYLEFNTQINKPTSQQTAARQTAIPLQDEVFVSPRYNHNSTPSFSGNFPAMQPDTSEYEKALRAVQLQMQIEEKRKNAQELDQLPTIEDYEKLYVAEKAANPQLIIKVRQQLNQGM